MPIDLYPNIAKVKRGGVYQNLPGFVQQSGDADIKAMIANSEISTTAQYTHPEGSYFILNDILYKAIVDIAINDIIAVGTNCEVAILCDDISELKSDVDDLKPAVEDLISDVKAIIDEVIAESTIETIAGSSVNKIMDVSIPSGEKYILLISGDETIFPRGYFFYANDTYKGGGFLINQEYEYTADTDISYISIYVSGANVAKSDSLGISITLRSINSNSLESRVGTAENNIEDIDVELDSLSNKVNSNESRLYALDGIANATWVDGDRSGDSYYNGYRIHNNPSITLPVGTTVTISDTNYKFNFYRTSDGYLSGWLNSYTLDLNGDYVFTIKRTDDAAYTTIDEFSSKILIVSPDGVREDVDEIEIRSKNNENRSCVAINPFRIKPCLEHLYITRNASNFTIPQQSLFDVRMAKKWGFDVIEANICTTQDGKHFTGHAGSNGNFGNWFVHVDGTTDISDTKIDTVTWSWIEQNVIYNTSIAKYKTRPCLLSEFLYECRQQNLIPLVYIADDGVMEETIAIMGEDNFIAYNGNRSKLPSTIISYFGSQATKTAILNVCNSYGKPFIYGMANPTDFTDDQLKEIIAELHENGFLISCAYVDADWYKYRYLGFDMIGAMQSINRIEHGNICNIHSINGFSDFNYTNATESNGVLTFSADGTISPDIANTNYDFCGIDIEIEFVGTITIPTKGEASGGTYTSDGTIPLFKSIPIINGTPELTISCTSGTVINNIDFKASEF